MFCKGGMWRLGLLATAWGLCRQPEVVASTPSWLAATQEENERFLRMGRGLSEEDRGLWIDAAEAFDWFQDDFARTGRLSEEGKSRLLEAATRLTRLAETKFDNERMMLLYGRLNDVYAPLSVDPRHCSAAALWCVQRALCSECLNAFATTEAAEFDCWNAAISNAISLYRRAGDDARAEATVRLARKHPFAATKYDRVDQTPKVYFPGLTAKPFWDPRLFDVVARLEASYAARRDKILAEVDAAGAFTRLFSPSAPLAPGVDDVDAPAWSEITLYDGREWDEEKCARFPTLVSVLRDGTTGEALPEICRQSRDPCGTDVVVTVLRLRPGSRILPHCGTTNRRLIMQFALRGSEGVAFTVGNETRSYGGDGHAIVFDDSFEHKVEHDGSHDRVVLFALLQHPDLRHYS